MTPLTGREDTGPLSLPSLFSFSFSVPANFFSFFVTVSVAGGQGIGFTYRTKRRMGEEETLLPHQKGQGHTENRAKNTPYPHPHVHTQLPLNSPFKRGFVLPSHPPIHLSYSHPHSCRHHRYKHTCSLLLHLFILDPFSR